MSFTRIVVLEDQPITLEYILDHIEREDREIILCMTYEEAQAAIQEKPTHFFIADRKLGNKYIDLHLPCLKKSYPHLGIFVITGHPLPPEKIVGADAIFIKPIDFQKLEDKLSPPPVLATEIRRLEDQLNAPENYLLQLIQGMDVGISIVDPRRRAIFINKKQREISGPIKKGKYCYESFAPHAQGFCEKCPIFDQSKSATHFRKTGFYEIQSIPLKDRQDNLVAHVKTCKEVTDRERLLDIRQEMLGTQPLRERIDKILEALKTMGPSNLCLYLVSKDGKHLIGFAANVDSEENRQFIGQVEPIAGDYYTETTFNPSNKPFQIYRLNMALPNPWSQHFPLRPDNYEWAEIPLYWGSQPVALLVLDYFNWNYPDLEARPIKNEVLQDIHDMGQEIADTVAADLDLRKNRINEMLNDLDRKVNQQGTTQAMLQTMIEGGLEIIRYYWEHTYRPEQLKVTGHIMRKDGGWLCKVAGQGIIYDKGHSQLDIHKDKNAPCVQVIDADKEVIWNDIFDDRFVQFFKDAACLNREEAVAYAYQVRAVCCLPVKLLDQTMGVVSIQSPKPYLFNDYILGLLRTLVQRCTPALTHLYLADHVRLGFSGMSNLAVVMGHLLKHQENKEKLLWAILTGLTHHEGLGYNRAYYFECATKNSYKAKIAVGPVTINEAKQIYITSRGNFVPLDFAIAAASQTNQGLTNQTQGIELPASVFSPSPRIHKFGEPVFSSLPEAPHYISFILGEEEERLGGIVLDRFYDKKEPSGTDLDILKVAAGSFGIILKDFLSREKEREELNHYINTTFHTLNQSIFDISNPLNYLEDLLQSGHLEKADLEVGLIRMRQGLIQQENRVKTLYAFIGEYEHDGRESPNRLYRFDFPFCWAGLIRECIERYKPLAAEREIKFELYVSEPLPEVYWDKDHSEILLWNLIHNAVKYSHRRKTIKIKVKENMFNHEIEMEVNNFGFGIPKEELEKIFDFRFRSILDDPSRPVPGTGMGLFQCRQIVARHGGKIWADSLRNNRQHSLSEEISWEGFNTIFALSIPIKVDRR